MNKSLVAVFCLEIFFFLNAYFFSPFLHEGLKKTINKC